MQEAAGAAEREGQGTGQGQALEQDGAAEGGAGSREAGGGAAGPGDSLPQAGTGAALEEPAPGEHPKGKGTGEAAKLGTEVSPGEQEVLVEGMEREVALGKPAAGGLPGWEADRAMVRGQDGITEEEEAAEEGLKGAVGLPAEEEEVGEPVSEAGQSPRQGGSAGKDAVVGAVSQGEEAVEDAEVAADGIARAVGPGGEEAVEEGISEGQEAMGKPGALWEALGDMEAGEAMPGGEEFVKPSEFSQLEASGEEWTEMRKAVTGADALESARAWQVGGSALGRVEDTVGESVEPGKGPALEGAPGLGALGGARGDPVAEGSLQVGETPAARQEEGAAEAPWSGNPNPSEGSKAETQRAERGKAEGEMVGGSAGAAGAGSGSEKEATERAAGSKEPAAGTEGWLGCEEVRGTGRCPGEGVVGEAAPGLCGPRAGEAGLVAIAVLGGQAGTAAMAHEEGLIGAVLGAHSGTGEAQEVPAQGRAAVREPRRDEGPAAGGREENQAAAGGAEGRGEVPAGAGGRDEAERESGAVLGSPGHGEELGAASLGEQPSAETSPSTPARGDGRAGPTGRGSTGGEGLCPDTQPQPAGTGTARDRDGVEQAGVKAGEEGPSPCENTRESEEADVSDVSGSAGEQRKDGPVAASPGVLAAADGGERNRSPRQVSPA